MILSVCGTMRRIRDTQADIAERITGLRAVQLSLGPTHTKRWMINFSGARHSSGDFFLGSSILACRPECDLGDCCRWLFLASTGRCIVPNVDVRGTGSLGETLPRDSGNTFLRGGGKNLFILFLYSAACVRGEP